MRRVEGLAAPADRAGAQTPPRRGRARMPEAERLRRLCEAAEEVFVRDGYTAARMDEVAGGAGMSKRTLYQLFPSKAELFEATIAAALEPVHLDSDLDGEPDTRRALTRILERMGRHLLSQRQTAIFRLVIAEAHRSPELAEASHRAMLGRGSNVLERRIAGDVARGNLEVADAAAAARLLYGMALGSTQLQVLLGLRAPPEADEIAALVQCAVSVFMRAATRSAA